MTDDRASRPDSMMDAVLVARLLALDPAAFGGVVLRGPSGPVRDSFIAMMRRFLPSHRPMIKMPHHIGEDRLLGGLDLGATLSAGVPVMERGLLPRAAGGLIELLSAERLAPDKAAYLAAAMDDIERGGFGLLACDEGIDDDEHVPSILTERMAFHIDLSACSSFDEIAGNTMDEFDPLNADIPIPEPVLTALSVTALNFGIGSLRPLVFAARAARLLAAIENADAVSDEHARAAAILVLAHRARYLPSAETPEKQVDQPPPPDENKAPDEDQESARESEAALADVILEAVRASLPKGLLERLDQASLIRKSAKSGAGSLSRSVGKRRGRPAGSKRGDPRHGARLNLIETLRVAAPWQGLRRRSAPVRKGVIVTKDDFRVQRYKQKRETTAIFVVDASGSAALRRMAEAKGAVEYVLADCYVRRDRVALIAFRGKSAEMLLPPTRSLQRARRSLAELPGGGGTPLAAAFDMALQASEQVSRTGGTPILVFLTDGRANITREGQADRAKAASESEEAAKALRASGVQSLMIDLSESRDGAARKLALAMGGLYLPLPYADASRISENVTSAMKAHRGLR
jgi:magnesium chelatase subunit D